MTEAQQKFTRDRIAELQNSIEKRWPLTESDWDLLAESIAGVVEKAHGNAELRDALFDAVEPYQKRAEKEREHA